MCSGIRYTRWAEVWVVVWLGHDLRKNCGFQIYRRNVFFEQFGTGTGRSGSGRHPAREADSEVLGRSKSRKRKVEKRSDFNFRVKIERVYLNHIFIMSNVALRKFRETPKFCPIWSGAAERWAEHCADSKFEAAAAAAAVGHSKISGFVPVHDRPPSLDHFSVSQSRGLHVDST